MAPSTTTNLTTFRSALWKALVVGTSKCCLLLTLQRAVQIVEFQSEGMVGVLGHSKGNNVATVIAEQVLLLYKRWGRL